MKRLLFLLCLVTFLTGCTTTFQNPWTHTMYTGAIEEEGLSLTIRPPFWSWCVNLYKWVKS